ncbi:MAG: arsenate reductase ArsC [Acidimicrobiales bacterium]
MPETRSFTDLTSEEQLTIRRTLEDLQREFDGTFDDETIEHFVVDSYERLAASARVTTFLGVLVERFARERLRVMATLGSAEPGTPGVLFLCVHNAGRSQMAAGWLRFLAAGAVNVYTGGSEPAAQLNSVVVEAMSEVGIDIGEEFPKPWTDEIVRAVDVVIAMGCGDVCPVYPGKRYADWQLEDPAGRDLARVRVIRDQIRSRVEGLVAELGVTVAR